MISAKRNTVHTARRTRPSIPSIATRIAVPANLRYDSVHSEVSLMECRIVLLVIAGMAVSAFTASAHHSLDATYDMKTEVRMEGKLLQVLLRNPHSFLQLEARDAAGTMRVWALEFPGAKTLAKAGITVDTLKKGDALVLTLNPSR